MLTVTKEFTFDAAHLLDGHEGLCKNLHGHTYKLLVTAKAVKGSEDRDMVCDFKDLKTITNHLVLEPMDHAVMLNTESKDPFEQELLQLCKKHGKKHFEAPSRLTAENMAEYMWEYMNSYLSVNKYNFRIHKIKLYETPTSYAEYTSGEEL